MFPGHYYELLFDGEMIKAECDSCHQKKLCTFWDFKSFDDDDDDDVDEELSLSTTLCEDCEESYLKGSWRKSTRARPYGLIKGKE